MNKDDAWAWITSCADKDGRRITQFEVMEGPAKGKKLFKGRIVLHIKRNPHPQAQPQSVPFEFDFPEGKTLTWCKKHFHEEADKAVKEWEKAQQKAQAEARKQVIPASGMPPSPLLGPSGKPIG